VCVFGRDCLFFFLYFLVGGFFSVILLYVIIIVFCLPFTFTLTLIYTNSKNSCPFLFSNFPQPSFLFLYLSINLLLLFLFLNCLELSCQNSNRSSYFHNYIILTNKNHTHFLLIFFSFWLIFFRSSLTW
jgi:hypothetical protein